MTRATRLPYSSSHSLYRPPDHDQWSDSRGQSPPCSPAMFSCRIRSNNRGGGGSRQTPAEESRLVLCVWTAGASQALATRSADARQANLHTDSTVLYVTGECEDLSLEVRGLLALAVARKRVDAEPTCCAGINLEPEVTLLSPPIHTAVHAVLLYRFIRQRHIHNSPAHAGCGMALKSVETWNVRQLGMTIILNNMFCCVVER